MFSLVKRHPGGLLAAAAVGVAVVALTGPVASIAQAAEATAAADPAGTVIVDEDFANDTALPAGWTAFKGDWSVQDGLLKQTSTDTSFTSMLTFGTAHADNFRFEAKVRFDSAASTTKWIALGLDMNPAGKAPWAQAAMRHVTTASNGLEFANEGANGKFTVPTSHAAPVSMADGSEHDISVEVHGTNGSYRFDGTDVMSTTQVQRSADGVFGLLMSGSTASFSSVTITDLDGVSTTPPTSPPATTAPPTTPPATTAPPTTAPPTTAPPTTAPPTDPGLPPVMTPTVVVDEDFSKETALPAGWTPFVGSWSVEDGLLKQTSTSSTPLLTFGQHLDDFRFDATLKYDSATNNTRWIALGLDVNPAGKAPWAQAAMRNETTIANGLEFANEDSSGHFTVPNSHAAPSSMAGGDFVDVSVEVHGTKGIWTFDGQKVFTSDAVARSANGVLGLIMNGATASFKSVKVTQLPPAPIVSLVQPGQTGLAIGHRGTASSAPEDTLVSEAASDALGSAFLEFDLHMTKDHVPVVMHDGTVDRTTNGTGSISNMTLDQLEALDAGSKFSDAYAGEKVPTFEAICSYVAAHGGNILPEFKDSGWTRDDVQAVIDIIHKYNLGSRTMFQSFTVPPLQLAEQVDPSIARAGLTGALADPVAYVKSFDGQALLPSFDAVTPELVATMHAAGIAVVTWTADNSSDWAKLTAAGVDGIMTNNPGKLIGWIEAYNQFHLGDAPTDPTDPPTDPTDPPSDPTDPPSDPTDPPTTPPSDPTAPATTPATQPATQPAGVIPAGVDSSNPPAAGGSGAAGQNTPQNGSLASTGAVAGPWIGVAAVLLFLGTGAVVMLRRREAAKG